MRSYVSRRTVMQQAAMAAAGLAVLPEFGWFAGAQDRGPQDASLRLGVEAAGRDLVPFEDYPENFSLKRPGTFTLPGQDVAGIDLRQVAPKIAPDKMFVVTHYNVPEINAANWQLQLNGMAGRPLTFTLDDLKKRPRVDRTVTFECGGNRPEVMHRMVGNATWTGCALKDVLEEARPAKEVLEAIFWAEDAGEETIRNNKYTMSFARSMALEDAMDAGAILAYEVEGQPLPIIHGYPVRLIVPGWYGVSNVKWLRRIEFSPRRFMGRFMGRDYVTIMGRQVGDRVEYTETSVTRIQVKSMVAKVLRPAAPGGRLSVVGVAYGDGTPIERVEVQVDGGAWKLAKLEPNKNPYSWTFWSLDVDPLSAGSHTVASRAFDRAGRTQPPDLSMKKSNWENNAVWTRRIRV
jgi:DMSO/TMAO reductase YedYZ molybdopterin-dependent catalytic subunit